jgi:hypothetical protein
MKRKRKTFILSLDKDDPKKELEFEVAFQLTMTTQQHYARMKKLVKQTMEVVKNNDYPKNPTIISRP